MEGGRECTILVGQTKRSVRAGTRKKVHRKKHRLYHCPSWRKVRNQILEETGKWEQAARDKTSKAQAATGGKRGDEGGAPSRVRCRGRMRTCDHVQEVGPGCLGRPHPPETALARHRSGGGRHAVPGGRQEPPSVATASACGSPVHGACGGGLVVSSKNLEIITNDERIRTDVRRNKVHADALRPCTRNLGVHTACGSEAHGRRGHGDASEAFHCQDDLL